MVMVQNNSNSVQEVQRTNLQVQPFNVQWVQYNKFFIISINNNR